MFVLGFPAAVKWFRFVAAIAQGGKMGLGRADLLPEGGRRATRFLVVSGVRIPGIPEFHGIPNSYDSYEFVRTSYTRSSAVPEFKRVVQRESSRDQDVLNKYTYNTSLSTRMHTTSCLCVKLHSQPHSHKQTRSRQCCCNHRFQKIRRSFHRRAPHLWSIT